MKNIKVDRSIVQLYNFSIIWNQEELLGGLLFLKYLRIGESSLFFCNFQILYVLPVGVGLIINDSRIVSVFEEENLLNFFIVFDALKNFLQNGVHLQLIRIGFAQRAVPSGIG